jgi:hypothetical protein
MKSNQHLNLTSRKQALKEMLIYVVILNALRLRLVEISRFHRRLGLHRDSYRVKDSDLLCLHIAQNFVWESRAVPSKGQYFTFILII